MVGCIQEGSSLSTGWIKRVGALTFGREPRLHRIPFGPLRGRPIFTSFAISPRVYFGIAEPWIARLAAQRVRSGDVVYDIGAHVGYTALLFARSVGPAGSVHAFELLPSVARRFLRKTIEANRLDNVVIHEVGLSDREETLELRVQPAMMTSFAYRPRAGEPTELCPTVRLDEYVARSGLPAPQMIKIDVEGAENQCLRGGAELIRSTQPEMIVEFHTMRLLQEGYALLSSWGYRLVLRSGVTLDLRQLPQTELFRDSVLCLPGHAAVVG